MDRPWSFHLPKGILFVIVEGLLIATAVVTGHGVHKASAFAKVSGCDCERVAAMQHWPSAAVLLVKLLCDRV